MTGSWDFLAPPPLLLRRERLNTALVINRACVMKPPYNPSGLGFGELRVGVPWRCWEGGAPTRLALRISSITSCDDKLVNVPMFPAFCDPL